MKVKIWNIPYVKIDYDCEVDISGKKMILLHSIISLLNCFSFWIKITAVILYGC